MSGHELGAAARTEDVYAARCQCGLNVWGNTLPALWAHHDVHLAAVRRLAQRRHPTGGRP